MAEIDARPLFVDNQDGNTLARAIKAHLEALRDAGKTPAELCVTSAYFNPQGLELLARELRHVPRIRLLLGAEPTPEALLPRRRPNDPPEPEFTRRRLRASLGRIEEALRADRNRIGRSRIAAARGNRRASSVALSSSSGSGQPHPCAAARRT